MISELDTVVLTEDISERGLILGDVGTVVLVHQNSKGYEVEFVTYGGETIAIVSLFPHQVRLAEQRELPHVRAVV
jgi:hypothetical protein